MRNAMWHATFFDTFDITGPATRTEIIHAEDEAAAGRLAIARMGHAMRVHVTRPIWGIEIPDTNNTTVPLELR
jgi:hypothetical protein